MKYVRKTVDLHGKRYKIIKPEKMSVWDCVDIIHTEDGAILGYKVKQNIAYFSKRYNKWIGCERGDRSDGATRAKDLNSFGWLFHDELCTDGTFEIGDKCNNWQASRVLTDIMKSEGYWFRTRTWFWGTWLGGGGRARANGMW